MSEIPIPALHTDGKPLDYIDAAGVQWLMCACGHRAGGGVTLGEQSALCPNCRLLVQVVGPILVVYPERLPAHLMAGEAVRKASDEVE